MKHRLLGIVLILLFFNTFSVALKIKTVKAGTIIVPDNYPSIQEALDNAGDGDTIFVRAGTYSEAITLNKSIALIGENRFYTTIQGSVLVTAGYNQRLDGITIENFTITSQHADGIKVEYSHNCTIRNNRLLNNKGSGINLHDSSQYLISGNTISNNTHSGIEFSSLHNCSNNIIYGNVISHNNYGVSFSGNETRHMTVHANSIANNTQGIIIWVDHWDTTNIFYHNNFINSQQIVSFGAKNSTWDNGYPCGGNYWGDYSGSDLNSGPFQNETGSDGIGDTPHIINVNNKDNYPLIDYFNIIHDIAVTEVDPSQLTVYQGDLLNISISVVNEGDFPETFNFSLFDNSDRIDTRNITLTRRTLLTFTYIWNTTNVSLGLHTLTGIVAPVIGETDLDDNMFVDGLITVLKVIHDISIVNATASRRVVGQGYDVDIDITVENQGDVTEYFDLVVFANSTILATFVNNTLASQSIINLVFSWNTTNTPYGNYSIIGYVEPVPKEEDVSDNTFPAGFVLIKWAYDTTGDGYCGITDIVSVVEHFSTKPSHPQWNEIFDINADGYVGIDDIVLVAQHFGESA